MTTSDFGEMLSHLQRGGLARRRGWSPLCIAFDPHERRFVLNGKPWLPTNSDLLANDWALTFPKNVRVPERGHASR